MSSLFRERQVLRPAQLNALARDLLEGSFPQVWVEGEIGNCSRPASGHLYFTLKDERAQVRCALFKPKAQLLRFQPRDGVQVLARGRLTLYEARGDYQLILDHLEEAGEGALRRALETLKAKLASEGLFDAARKRPMPTFPRRLAVITSPSGAAVRDVLTVLSRRFPLLEVDILPVPVQGEGAAAQIRSALERAGASGRYDALLLTRGGGSLEDLWAFNDEALARAISACPVPVVSAVGHEIDSSLSDFVADLRAATPSAAAELLVPEQQALRARLTHAQTALARNWQRQQAARAQRCDLALLRLQSFHPQQRLLRGRERLQRLQLALLAAASRNLQRSRIRLDALRMRLQRQHPGERLHAARLRLSLLGQRQQQGLWQLLPPRQHRLSALARALATVSPLATLGRGYALLQQDDGRVVRSATQVSRGERLLARLAEGRLTVRVEESTGSD